VVTARAPLGGVALNCGCLLVLHVATDVLGGRFAVNAGEPGEVCYFGPDTLAWSGLGIHGYPAFLTWVAGGGLGEVFADLRWPGWEADVAPLAPGDGLSVYPPLWSREARDGVSRAVVPLAELVALHADTAAQVADPR
jgi:hypothetical protein